jgi:hypothetical protein
MNKRRVDILAGTDSNQIPGTPAQLGHGTSLHTELQLLVEAGLAPIDALRAATTLPAQKFRCIGDRGVIAAGKRAGLLMVDGRRDVSSVCEFRQNARRRVPFSTPLKLHDSHSLTQTHSIASPLPPRFPTITPSHTRRPPHHPHPSTNADFAPRPFRQLLTKHPGSPPSQRARLPPAASLCSE